MAGDRLDPEVAVIIPVFKLSGLLCEAVTSCLHQTGGTAFRLLLINDGCEQPETDEICRQYAAAHASNVLYLRSPVNRGLSHARNAGTRLALEAWPTIDSVLFLDADDRLSPDGVDRFHQRLHAAHEDSDQKIGWVFSDPYQFGGIHGYTRKVQTYSVLWHMAGNVCNPTSLISRQVFDEGIWFDEEMRSGSEDWQFWMRLVEAGYRGAFVPGTPFFYRRRPESMMVNAMRDHARIRQYVHRKTPRVFNRDFVLRTEHVEHPRFAFVVAPSVPVRLGTDAALPMPEIEWSDFAERIRASIADNLAACPAILVVAAQETIHETIKLGLCHALLWRIELALRSSDVVSISWDQRIAGDALRIGLANRSTEFGTTAIVACRADLLRTILREQAPNEPRCVELQLTVSSPDLAAPPPDMIGAWTAVKTAFENMAKRCTAFDYRPDIVRWSPRGKQREELVDDILGFGPTLPMVTTGEKNLGVIVGERPSVDDWTRIHNLADDFGGHGWQTHLFTQAQLVEIPDRRRSSKISSMTFLPRDVIQPNGPWRHYSGAPISQWMMSGDRAPVKGLLSWLDVVFFWGGSPLLSAANELDALIVAALPNTDFATTAANMTPIAYEHVVNLFVTPNDAATDWLAARGVPRQKISILPALAVIGARRTSTDRAHDPNTASNREARERSVSDLARRFASSLSARQVDAPSAA